MEKRILNISIAEMFLGKMKFLPIHLRRDNDGKREA
jgi:hypothetical protein